MTADDSTQAAHRAIEAVWRLESARIIAGLAGLLRDVGLAEELAQDALVAALEQWPADGIPANPGAWLMLTARHRAIDRIRRNERLAGKLNLLGRELETGAHERPRRVRRRPGRGQDRRRPAAADVHLLPSGAVHRGEDRADPAPARRPDHRGDRPRVPGRGADDRQADRAGQADAGQQAGPVRGSVAGRTAWAGSPRCSRCSTWCSTRDTRRWRATTGCALRYAAKRCASAACSPS